MTPDHDLEWEHEYQTRLGMAGLSAGDVPTPEQDAQARAAADAHVAAIQQQERDDSR
jgi:hypothetical protein